MRLECFMPGAGCKIQSSARRSAWPSGPHHPFAKRGLRAPACAWRPTGLRVFGSGRTQALRRWRRRPAPAVSRPCGSNSPMQPTPHRALRALAACTWCPPGLRVSGSGRTPGRWRRRPVRAAVRPRGSDSPMQRTPRRAVARRPTRQFRTAGILRLPARNARASHLPKSTAGTAAPNLCRSRCASFGLDLTLSQRKPGP